MGVVGCKTDAASNAYENSARLSFDNSDIRGAIGIDNNKIWLALALILGASMEDIGRSFHRTLVPPIWAVSIFESASSSASCYFDTTTISFSAEAGI